MASTEDGEGIQESSVSEKPCKMPSSAQQSVEKKEDHSTNGTLPCTSMTGSSKSTNLLRPSTFSSIAASGSPAPVFGSTITSSHLGSNSPNFGALGHRNPFSLRPSVFGSVVTPDKNSAAASPKKPVVLRASQLETLADSSVVSSTTNNVNSSFVLSPAKLNNPFKIAANESEDSSLSKVTSTSPAESLSSSQEPEKVNSSKLEPPTPRVLFVPFSSSTSSTGNSQVAAQTGTSNVSSFVFGQNLHERVEVATGGEPVNNDGESRDAVMSESRTCDDVSKTNGTSPEMLFSSVVQKDLADKQSDSGNEDGKRKSLSEAAREYEESRAVKRKYEEVTVKTGEEEEMNILQINCKLFAFNKDKSTWVERGRGTLRLNDLSMENRTQSRVVMRVSGSLRVVLNTKIWAEMDVAKPSDKSVRLTAMEGGGEIKVFLVMAGVKEIDQLFKALEWRVNNQKKMASVCEKSLETNKS